MTVKSLFRTMTSGTFNFQTFMRRLLTRNDGGQGFYEEYGYYYRVYMKTTVKFPGSSEVPNLKLV